MAAHSPCWTPTTAPLFTLAATPLINIINNISTITTLAASHILVADLNHALVPEALTPVCHTISHCQTIILITFSNIISIITHSRCTSSLAHTFRASTATVTQTTSLLTITCTSLSPNISTPVRPRCITQLAVSTVTTVEVRSQILLQQKYEAHHSLFSTVFKYWLHFSLWMH